MEWTLKATPTNEALTNWNWTALRSDQNEYFQGFNEPTSTAAIEEARAAAMAFERRVAMIDSHIVEEAYTPVVEVNVVLDGPA